MRIAITIVSFLVASATAFAQDQKPNNWSVGAGVGLFHYINTLDLGANLAKTNHVGYTFRFMWEPEHRVSMGLESGYYTLYALDRPAGTAKLTTIPLLLSFRIRLLPELYIAGGPGMAIMYSDVTVLDNTANSSFLSLANLHVSAMYRKKINDRFDIGGEFKFLNFGKTEDYGYSIQVVGAYHFRFKK